jgi:hypothetical protein
MFRDALFLKVELVRDSSEQVCVLQLLPTYVVQPWMRHCSRLFMAIPRLPIIVHNELSSKCSMFGMRILTDCSTGHD